MLSKSLTFLQPEEAVELLALGPAQVGDQGPNFVMSTRRCYAEKVRNNYHR